MPRYKTIFTKSDAWVFKTITASSQSQVGVSLNHIIRNGDALNHAIFSFEELKNAFEILSSYHLIDYKENNIARTPEGDIIYQKAEQRPGGMFSQIENTWKTLNSPFIELPEKTNAKPISLSELQVNEAYNQYQKPDCS